MQHGVFRAADVQVDRHPGFFFFRIDEALVVFGIDKSQVVPTRPGPLRHGVDLTSILLAIDHRIQPLFGCFAQWRFRLAVRFVVVDVWQVDRQVRFIHRAKDSGWISRVIQFVQDWEWLAPEPLPTE